APYDLCQGALAEVVGTIVLVLAIFALAVDPRGAKAPVGLGIGLGLAAAILTFGPVSGASLNFARTFGPELVTAIAGGTTHWSQLLVYLVAPPGGARRGRARVAGGRGRPAAGGRRPRGEAHRDVQRHRGLARAARRGGRSGGLGGDRVPGGRTRVARRRGVGRREPRSRARHRGP